MMLTPHMLVGASLGAAIRRPWIAYPLAFASHFMLDRVPHVDPSDLPGVHGNIAIAAVAAGETLLGIALLIWALRGKPWARVATIAAFYAVVIDLIDNIPPWGDAFSRWPTTAWFSAFHTAGGDVAPDLWILGLVPQVLLTALALWYLRAKAARPAPPVSGSRPMEVAR